MHRNRTDHAGQPILLLNIDADSYAFAGLLIWSWKSQLWGKPNSPTHSVLHEYLRKRRWSGGLRISVAGSRTKMGISKKMFWGWQDIGHLICISMFNSIATTTPTIITCTGDAENSLVKSAPGFGVLPRPTSCLGGVVCAKTTISGKIDNQFDSRKAYI